MGQNILFFSSKHNMCVLAQELFLEHFPGAQLVTYESRATETENFSKLAQSNYDLIVSFLYPRLIPESMLAQSKMNVNFHPGSRDYPGTGCFNFALYEDAKEYGAVCHHMTSKADNGTIIFETKFQMTLQDTIETLQQKAHQASFDLLKEFCSAHKQDDVRLKGNAALTWKRKSTTRKMLDAMSVIDPSMSEEEILRRYRAFHHVDFPLKIKLQNIEIEIQSLTRTT